MSFYSDLFLFNLKLLPAYFCLCFLYLESNIRLPNSRNEIFGAFECWLFEEYEVAMIKVEIRWHLEYEFLKIFQSCVH